MVNSLVKKSRVNWAWKDPEKNKDVSDWDNGTSDCVYENGMPFENNSVNMKVLAETNRVAILTLEKYFFSHLSKRRVIGDGVRGKSLLHNNIMTFLGNWQ